MKKEITDVMKRYDKNIKLKSNQRIKKSQNIVWLEEKQSFKTSDGDRHNVWTRIGIIEQN